MAAATLATSSQDTGEEALQRSLFLWVEHGEEAAHRLALAPAHLVELRTALRREVDLDHPLVGGLPCARDETGLLQPLARGGGRAGRDAERFGQGSDADRALPLQIPQQPELLGREPCMIWRIRRGPHQTPQTHDVLDQPLGAGPSSFIKCLSIVVITQNGTKTRRNTSSLSWGEWCR